MRTRASSVVTAVSSWVGMTGRLPPGAHAFRGTRSGRGRTSARTGIQSDNGGLGTFLFGQRAHRVQGLVKGGFELAAQEFTLCSRGTRFPAGWAAGVSWRSLRPVAPLRATGRHKHVAPEGLLAHVPGLDPECWLLSCTVLTQTAGTPWTTCMTGAESLSRGIGSPSGCLQISWIEPRSSICSIPCRSRPWSQGWSVPEQRAFGTRIQSDGAGLQLTAGQHVPRSPAIQSPCSCGAPDTCFEVAPDPLQYLVDKISNVGSSGFTGPRKVGFFELHQAPKAGECLGAQGHDLGSCAWCVWIYPRQRILSLH